MSTKKSNVPAKIDDTAAAFKVITNRLAELTKVTESAYLTSGTIPNTNGLGNIKDLTKIEDIITVFSGALAREQAFNASAAVLGINPFPVFKLGGFEVADIKADCIKRMAVIKYESEVNKLKDMKAKYEQLMTNEDKKKLLDAELLAMVGGIESANTEDAVVVS